MNVCMCLSTIDEKCDHEVQKDQGGPGRVWMEEKEEMIEMYYKLV